MRKYLLSFLLAASALTLSATNYPGYGDIGGDVAFIHADGTPAQDDDYAYVINYSVQQQVAVIYSINPEAFVGTVIVPAYAIAEDIALPVVGWAAGGYTSLATTVMLPQQLKFIIGTFPFPNLESLSIPGSVTHLQVDALQNCTSLRSLTLEDGTEPLEITGKDYWSKGAFTLAPISNAVIGRTVISQDPPFNGSDQLTTLTLRGQGTDIVDKEFYGVSNLQTLTISDGVSSIGKQSFAYCRLLSGVDIPGSVSTIGQQAFEGDTTMTAVTLGEGLRFVGYNAFYNCHKVGALTLPASLDSINGEAFNGMAGVKSLTVADTDRPLKIIGARYYGKGAFSDMDGVEAHLGRDIELDSVARPPFYQSKMVSLTMGDAVTTMNKEAFYQNNKLRTATLGSSLTLVADDAFAHCHALEGIDIPGSVITIGKEAFYNDSTMTAVTLHEGLRFVGYNAFYNCRKVGALTLPASLDSISGEAFNGMAGVASLTVAGTDRPLKIIGARYYGKGAFSDMDGVEAHLGRDIELDSVARPPFYQSKMVSLTMGDAVTTMNDKAFYNSSKLRTATLGSSLSLVADDAFAHCHALEGIEIPGSVLTIGKEAFYNDTTMTAVTLHEGLRFVGYNAFYNCRKVGALTLPASLDSISGEAFNGMTGVKSLTVADTDRPLKIIGARHYGKGAFSDMGVAVAYIGRNIELADDNVRPPLYQLTTMVTTTLGDKITHLHSGFFSGCSGIRNIYSNNVTPPVCAAGNVEFSNIDKNLCYVHVPGVALNAYREADGWRMFFDHIVSDDIIDVPGDATGDGMVDVDDINVAINIILGAVDYQPGADVNGDGTVDVEDVNLIINIVLGRD